jgi:endonuclease/exonuclease/phosphatase family metal-dependent hydrolase
MLEVQGKLDAMTGGKWQSDFDDCKGDGRQHVGLLFDTSRVKVSEMQDLAGLNPRGEACAGSLRPGFSARVKLPSGKDIQVVSVHLDSGEAQRDYDNRLKSIAALGELTASAKRLDGIVVLGDFNTMGCPDCTPEVSREDELAALDASAASVGFARLAPEATKICTHYMGGKPSWLDHVLVSKGPLDIAAGAHMEVAGGCMPMRCKGVKPGVRKPRAFEKLSDHCPVVVQLASDKSAAAPTTPPAKGAAPTPAAAANVKAAAPTANAKTAAPTAKVVAPAAKPVAPVPPKAAQAAAP